MFLCEKMSMRGLSACVIMDESLAVVSPFDLVPPETFMMIGGSGRRIRLMDLSSEGECAPQNRNYRDLRSLSWLAGFLAGKGNRGGADGWRAAGIRTAVG